MSVLHIELELPRDRFTLAVSTTFEAPTVGIFGPSGAGKSSLLQALAGIDRGARGRIVWNDQAHQGSVVWLDTNLSHQSPPERRDIGYVPQDGLLFPHLDVRSNLLSGSERARRRGLDPQATLATVSRILEIEALLDRRPATLSGGERQRVALARAICSGPSLLLLDEPLAALDLPLRRRILPLLRQVRDVLELPLVLVSHDPTEILALCDETVVLQQGRVLHQGPTREVLADPAVFPMAREQGFENLLPAVLDKSPGEPEATMVSAVRLATAGADTAHPRAPHLLVPRVDKPDGTAVLVGLPAREILIANEKPRGLSARNILPARVESVRSAARLRLVSARLETSAGVPVLPAILVEITPQAERELGLVVGLEIHLIVKTMGCTVF